MAGWSDAYRRGRLGVRVRVAHDKNAIRSNLLIFNKVEWRFDPGGIHSLKTRWWWVSSNGLHG